MQAFLGILIQILELLSSVLITVVIVQFVLSRYSGDKPTTVRLRYLGTFWVNFEANSHLPSRRRWEIRGTFHW